MLTSSIQMPLRSSESPAQRILLSVAFVVSAGCIRFLLLERQSLWNDEMFSLEVAGLPLARIQPNLIAYFHHPPLFFYCLHAVVHLFGTTAWTLRFLSACCGSLTAGLVYFATSVFLNRRAALVAGAICLLSPFHLAYSQEGRPYAMAAFLCLATFCLMFMTIREERRIWNVLYAASLVALLYTHHWGIFVLASQMLFILTEPRISRPTKKHVLLIWAIVGVCYLPEAIVIPVQSAGHGTPGWSWVETPNVMEPAHLIAAFAGSYFRMASSIYSLSLPVILCSAIALLFLLLRAVVGGWRTSADLAYRGFLIGAGATLLIPFALSFWKPEIFVWYRYPVIVVPVVCVAAGGVFRTRGGKIAALAVAILLMSEVLGTIHYFNWSKSNVRDVATYVESVTGNDVRLLIRPKIFARLLNFYYRGTARQLDEAYLDEPVGEIVDTAASFAYVSLDVPNEIRDYMDQHFDKLSERKFPGEAHLGIIVDVYRQPPDTVQTGHR